jgi:hypothetical protein
MRRRYAFLLTLMRDDEAAAALRGKVRCVTTGNEMLFAGEGDLLAFVRDELVRPPAEAAHAGDDATRPGDEPAGPGLENKPL